MRRKKFCIISDLDHPPKIPEKQQLLVFQARQGLVRAEWPVEASACLSRPVEAFAEMGTPTLAPWKDLLGQVRRAVGREPGNHESRDCL